jgi:hypothetical protein
MKSDGNRPITIEDLLRLKRAELPPTEFWATFDRELRAKQLSALVEKRPWWQRVPNAFAGIMRYRIALGVSAIAVLSFVSLRNQEAPSSAKSTRTVALATQETAAVVVPLQQVSLPTTAAIVSATPIAAPEHLVALAVPALGDVPAPVGAFAAGGVVVEANPQSQSPIVRHSSENLAVMQATDRSAARSLLAAASGFEDRAMPSRVAVEPLQQMTPPSESRRARLLTAMVSMASLESSLRTTERAANRIAHERLYDDSMSRFDARGDRLQVKF